MAHQVMSGLSQYGGDFTCRDRLAEFLEEVDRFCNLSEQSICLVISVSSLGFHYLIFHLSEARESETCWIEFQIELWTIDVKCQVNLILTASHFRS